MPRSARRVMLRAMHGFVRALVAAVLIAVGIGVYQVLYATRPSPEMQGVGEEGLPVRVMDVRPVEVARWWEGYGTVRPVREADVAAEVSGVVSQRAEHIDPGEWIERDDVIVRLDDREYEAQYERSLALIDSYKAQLDNLDVEAESLDEQVRLARESIDLIEWEIEQLRAAKIGGAASQVEVERLRVQLKNQQRTLEELRRQRGSIGPRRAQIEAQLASERSSARLAELNVERCTIRAPISGVIQRVDVREGERVSIGSPVARIVDVRVLEVPLQVPISAGHKLRVGDPAELISRSSAERVWRARTSRIAPEADPSTRTITVFVEMEQDVPKGSAPDLIPGRFVMARVREAGTRDGIVVPRRVIRDDRVMVVDAAGRVEARDVSIAHYAEARYPSLDEFEEQWAVISAGLGPGDRVIVSNLDEITPGMAVDVAGAPDSEPQAGPGAGS